MDVEVLWKLWRKSGRWKLLGGIAALITLVRVSSSPMPPGRRTAEEVAKAVKAYSKVRSPSPGAGTDTVHVCLSSDDADLRSSAVALRSAFANAADPSRLQFHFITTAELAPTVRDLFRAHLQDIPIEVHADVRVQEHIAAALPGRGKTAKVRKGLTSVFNFVPFYLDRYVTAGPGASPPKRLIYLDTDTVIMGDLGELQDIDLEHHPCAAVKYCLQPLEKYIDFEVLRELGFTNYDPKACIANRGLLVIDVQKWKELRITEEIEAWMQRYAKSPRLLWKSGVSQPPWLLAMREDFLDLGDEWNCNSLGRDKMPYVEALFLRESGFDHEAVRKIGASFSEDGGVDPYVVTCSEKGKMLHYNGGVKPWNWRIAYADRRLPICAVPENIPDSFNFNSAISVKLFCKPTWFVSCVDIWSTFISEETACALRDFSQEWPEEPDWIAAMGEKVAKEEEERRDREKARIHKQELQREELKARAEAQVKVSNMEELAAAADTREREADRQRKEFEEQKP